MDDRDLDSLLAKVAATPRRRPPVDLVPLDRYELIRRLGGGGFGDVYEARAREHATPVALKALKDAQPDAIYRFKREFRLVADLGHPNLVRLHELFCEHEQWFLTMELVAGRPLGEHLADQPDDLRACFGQLAQAIAVLHGARSLHRDLKPSNVLVEPGGRLVLLDFGLARPHETAMQTVIAGTPAYMAPELAAGDAPTRASDWYGFGVMLYEALAGRLPFTGDPVELLERKLTSTPVAPGGDPRLAALALALLAPEPGVRPDARAILAELAPGVSIAPAVRRPDLIGRDGELAALDQALVRARDGGAAVVTIAAPPGHGASALLARFADRAAAEGALVLAGRAHPAERVACRGLDGAIDALADHLVRQARGQVGALVPPGAGALARLFPVLERVDAFARARPDARDHGPEQLLRAAAAALVALLRRLGALAPVVLVVDDLHWLDADGARLLADLLAAAPPRLLLVASHRAAAAGRTPPLDAVLAAAGERRVALPLPPLPDGSVPGLRGRALAREVAALPPDARALLAAVARADGPVAQREALAALASPRGPLLVDDLRRQRLLDLAPDGTLALYHEQLRALAC